MSGAIGTVIAILVLLLIGGLCAAALRGRGQGLAEDERQFPTHDSDGQAR